MSLLKQITAVLALIAGLSLLAAPALAAGGPAWAANCTALNAKYPHGVGLSGARDHTSGRPVTTFKHSDTLYRQLMTWNSRLDGDKDGIACEKA